MNRVFKAYLFIKMESIRKFIRNILSETLLMEGKEKNYYTLWNKIELAENADSIFNGTENDISQKIAAQLNIGRIAPLGKGTQGFTYHVPNNKVMKITKDQTEAYQAKKIQGKSMKYLANVYNTYMLQGKYSGTFVIISELLAQDSRIAEGANNFKYCIRQRGISTSMFFQLCMNSYLNDKDWKDKLVEELKSDLKNNETGFQSALWFMKQGFGLMLEILSNGIKPSDFHVKNMGLKRNGNLGLFDLGYAPGAKKNNVKPIHITEDNGGNNQTVYVLIGPPAIGKSTYVKNSPGLKNAIVISRDDIAIAAAKKYGLTYDDLFKYPPQDSKIGQKTKGLEKFGTTTTNTHPKMKEAFPLAYSNSLKINALVDHAVASRFLRALKTGQDIVVDMTNMDKRARAMNLAPLEGHDIKKVAVIFNFQDRDTLRILSHLAHRRAMEIEKKGGSKTITPEIIEKSIKSYEKPSAAEGFDEIINFDTLIALKKVVKESLLSTDEINKKELPWKYSDMLGSFLATKQNVPEVSSLGPNPRVEDLAEKFPALFDEFAEYIYSALRDKSVVG